MKSFVAEQARHAGWTNADSFFEVGCGAGAFLESIAQAVGGCLFGGIDISPALVAAGRSWFPELDLRVQGADAVPTVPLVDHVLAFGVLLYFPGWDYAERVIERMKTKARRSVCLFDLPDQRTRELSERFRRAAWPPGEYEARYEGLDHLYFDRAQVAALFSSADWSVRVAAQQIAGYENSDFRFNVVARRRSASGS